MHNNKASLQATIRNLALQTTASAILSLNAESVLADSCPAYITATSGLAGMVCEFDSTTGSNLTVVQDGVVGSIEMTNYTPTAPSSLVVNAGGTVSTSDGSGAIKLDGSELANGLLNQGTVSHTNGSGITISNTSTVTGGISNSGLISVTQSGISVNKSRVNDGISNSGTVTSTNGSAIVISVSSTINGGITNSGTLKAGGVDVGIAIVGKSSIEGDIINSGLIEATGAGNGITMYGTSIITGGITNSGTIRSAYHVAVDVGTSEVQGDVVNHGTISGGNRGLSIHNAGAVGGNIINSGTITGSEHALSVFSATTISGGISNSGVINGGQNGVFVSSSARINGGISNSGLINGGQNGIFVFSNTMINGGISNSGTIQGSIYALNITADSTVAHVDILGQHARLIGAVEAPNTTFNITDGALFTSEGTYNVSIFNIADNARFNMNNAITANAVNNSGTLALSNSLQNIIGNYTQQVGGLVQAAITNATQYGQLAVTGVTDLSQSGSMYAQVTPNTLLHAGEVLANVVSGNTLVTPNNGFHVSTNSYFWTFTPALNNLSNGVNLITGINPGVYTVCLGSYCQGAATAVTEQLAQGNTLFSPYAPLPTADAFRVAVSQATPELTNATVQVTQLVTRSVMDMVPMWNSLHGKSAGDAMFSQPGKLWVKPYGASLTQNERHTVDGFNASAYGAVLGKDIQLSHDWMLGGALAAGGDTLHGKAVLSGQSINSTVYQGMFYGAKTLANHVYLAGQGLVGYGANNTTRAIPLYASTSKGSYNNWFTNLRAEAGWSTYAFGPNFVFTPEVDASYLFINQGRYQEYGSPMDLLVAANNNSSFTLGAYANGAYHLNTPHKQHDVTLTGYAGFSDAVLSQQPRVVSSFVAGGSSFQTVGIPLNGLVFRGGAGLTLAKKTHPILVELNYDIQSDNNAYSGTGSATIKYKA